ncbi:GNAT family N-acetyltransferase [Nocardia panacis]|uniref:GNAT family N-acetyltransferase n=1 Tax=Nocardia panacis TaxID=2340916 RepID=A0A3A4K578_9NOCA|nr:GNAT family N-acetyltransferase [Nocardia panacis]RJO75633.1 GNAT family N-acetyltransferase [Nocardia panacis]
MPELIAPTVALHAAWLAAHEEWGPGSHEDGFGLLWYEKVDTEEGFAAWVARMNNQSGHGRADGEYSTYRWIVEDGQVLGGIVLRHDYSDLGHIGYGIRPSARRRKLATWALARMLDEARAAGLPRVLVVCAVDNIASARTIERNGGVLEGIRQTDIGPARRYWIELGMPD